MRLRQYDNLRNFVIAARHGSLASAAEELCLTKGALSHQIRNLEQDLGFALFTRHSRGVRLSDKGQSLLVSCQSAFDQIEQRVEELNGNTEQTLTIGTTTYFASRWLSPRLMDFIRQYPEIRLRIQPMIELFELRQQGIDLAIRWGNGRWTDCRIEKLFDCPAWPTGNEEAKLKVEREGLETAFSSFTLLRDREDSEAWSEWYDRAGLTPTDRSDTLIVPDPNVRVQAVLDGQGVALNDELVRQEIRDGRLFRLSEIELGDYGYFLAHRTGAQSNKATTLFVEWLRSFDHV